jgi:hypothetical protein
MQLTNRTQGPSSFAGSLLVIIAFASAFYLIPFSKLDGLSLMPGDIGDARLNNYFLESAYLYLRGELTSIWNNNFFYPFPYVMGFSDNLFGSAPVYILARIATGEPDTAFQIWFFAGYFLNFLSCFFALRLLGFGVPGACGGALVFAFALPTTAHAMHAQLHYRFGIPLSLAYFTLFLRKGNSASLLISIGWMIWQFYSGIYMGFFNLIIMTIMFVTNIFLTYDKNDSGAHTFFAHFIKKIIELFKGRRPIFYFFLAVFFFLMLLLFWPYLRVQSLYQAFRDWGAIRSMLPRLQSYFINDHYWLWKLGGIELAPDMRMRHEHQMFSGIMPLLLGMYGAYIGWRLADRQVFWLMASAIATMIVLTFYIKGFSLWFLFHWLPLASAIRAMTRFDQALLFPVAYFVALAIDRVANARIPWPRLVSSLLIALLVLEFSATTFPSSAKSEWRGRIEAARQAYPSNPPQDAIFFAAQGEGPFYAAELDGMWVSLQMRRPTINGYSGYAPDGFQLRFGSDCTELQRRIESYMNFSKQNHLKMVEIENRILPIGFSDCKK